MNNSSHRNVVAAFYEESRSCPDRPALMFDDGFWTYRQVRELAAVFAIRFADAGLTKGQRFCLDSHDPAVTLPSALAAMICGAEIYGANSLPDDDGCIGLFTVTANPECADENVLLVDSSWSPANYSQDEKSALWDGFVARDGDNPSWYLGWSEKTGASSNVTQQTVLETGRRLGLDDQDDFSLVSLWPAGSYEFLSRALAALCHGGTIVPLDDWGGWRSQNVTLISAAPSQVLGLEGSRTEREKIDHLEVLGDYFGTDLVEIALSSFHKVSVSAENVIWGHLISITVVSDPFGEHEWLQPKETNQLNAAMQNGGDFETPQPCPLLIKRESGSSDWIETDLYVWRDEMGRVFPLRWSDPESISRNGESAPAAFIEAALLMTDGIVDAAVFVSPRPNVSDLVGLVVFSSSVNPHQTTENARRIAVNMIPEGLVPSRLHSINRIPRDATGRVDRVAAADLITRVLASDQIVGSV